MVEQRQSALQRIQVGLVGLVVVLLFVSLATMVLDRVTESPPIGEAARNGAVNVDGTTEAGVPDEPLAELGVTPVAKEGADSNASSPAPLNKAGQAPAGSRR